MFCISTFFWLIGFMKRGKWPIRYNFEVIEFEIFFGIKWRKKDLKAWIHFGGCLRSYCFLWWDLKNSGREFLTLWRNLMPSAYKACEQIMVIILIILICRFTHQSLCTRESFWQTAGCSHQSHVCLAVLVWLHPNQHWHGRARTYAHTHTHTDSHVHMLTHPRAHTFVNTQARTHQHTHLYAHTYTHTPTHAQLHTYTNAHTQIGTSIRIRAHTHTYARIHTHAYAHTYLYTHILVHAHTYAHIRTQGHT